MNNKTFEITHAPITLEQTPAYILHIYTMVEEMVAKMDKLHAPPEEIDPIYPMEPARAIVDLSRPTMYYKVSHGEINAIKKGKKLYFLKSELTKYLMSGQRKTKAEKYTETIDFLQARKGGKE